MKKQYAVVNPSTKDKILELSKDALYERYQGKYFYHFFKGACEDATAAVTDPALLGQSWSIDETLDYIPTQDIRNKVKPLLKKQARFMFGVAPYVLIKPLDGKDKKKAEELRKYIDRILNDNGFWSDTLKAFLATTIKKRVLLRVEANPLEPIRIFYHSVEDFDFEVSPSNYKELKSVSIVAQDRDTMYEEADKQLWYRYTYFMQEGKCYLTTRVYTGVNDLDNYTEETMDTSLTELPAWVITNGGELGDIYGESDVQDLMSSQEQYNRKTSDFADVLRFGMFAPPVITDATENSVNNLSIAPNAIMPLVSLPDKSASATRLQTNIPSDAIEKFLDRAAKDMHEALSIPLPDQVKDVASAKSIKFMYADLIARCEEKWNDWEPAIRGLIKFIVKACSQFNCYGDWNKEWNDLQYTIVLQHKYPVPEDETDKKTVAMEEVRTNVRSHKSYIKDFTDIEDDGQEWQDILDEQAEIANATTDQFQTALIDETNNKQTNEPKMQPVLNPDGTPMMNPDGTPMMEPIVNE